MVYIEVVMTEEEAKRKWCPHGMIYSSNGSYNRTEMRAADGPCKCIASDCMGWRWVTDPLVDFVANGKTVIDYQSEHGYCGLAGPV